MAKIDITKPISKLSVNGSNWPIVSSTSTTLESKTATPSTVDQQITASAGCTLSGVTIAGDADLVPENIKSGIEIFGVTGTCEPKPDTETQSVTPSASTQIITPSANKLLSSVTVAGDSDLIASNIRQGIEIFGITGSYNPIPTTETKTVTPSASAQTITPTSGSYLSSVTVNGDSDLIASNIKSGVEIFGVTGSYVGSGSGTGSGFDTSQMRGASKLFYMNSSSSLDLTGLNTSLVQDMSYMFYNCQGITTLDVSSLNTSSTTSMAYMFTSCSQLTSLDLSNFNTSKVTNMQNMFQGCSKLTSLDLSSFNTSKVTFISYIFASCSALTSLDLSGFDTSKVTTMERAFYGCSKLTSLDLSNFDTSVLTNINYLFYNCSALTSVNLSNWNLSKITSYNNPFQGCTSIKTLYFGSRSDSAVQPLWSSTPFYYCSALEKIYVPGHLLSAYKTATYWSYYADKLDTLDVQKNLDHIDFTDSLHSINLQKNTSGQVSIEYYDEDNYPYIADSQKGVTYAVTYGPGTISSDGILTVDSSAAAGDTIVISATSTYDNSISISKDISIVSIAPSFSVDTTEWRVATTATSPTTDVLYESNSNYNVNSGIAKTTITLMGYSTFVIYIRSYAESGYDYVIAMEANTTPTSTSWNSSANTWTNVKANTKSTQSASAYTKVEYTGLDNSITNTITLWYGKDSSGNTSADRGYFYVAESECS